MKYTCGLLRQGIDTRTRGYLVSNHVHVIITIQLALVTIIVTNNSQEMLSSVRRVMKPDLNIAEQSIAPQMHFLR